MMFHEIFAWIRGLGALFVGAISYMYGEMNGLLVALFVAIVLDYATGLLKAGITHTLSSEIGFKGILKKILILCVVGLAHVIDNCVGSGETWRNIAIVFYICNEGLSLLENAVACGLPVPQKIKDALLSMEENGKDGAKNGGKNNL